MKFLRFWWDFLVGDDWVAALAVVVAIALTGITGFWWFLPLAVVAILYMSLRRAT